jgi:hypothetical protein|tara:strand:+ start:9419 stop:9592 length:174 start_codon:yes stop_codon:yes gene_type:complete
MSEDVKQGKPWKNSRPFATYEEADVHRLEILSDPSKEVKVKKREGGRFVVKSRTKKD